MIMLKRDEKEICNLGVSNYMLFLQCLEYTMKCLKKMLRVVDFTNYFCLSIYISLKQDSRNQSYLFVGYASVKIWAAVDVFCLKQWTLCRQTRLPVTGL